MLLFGIEPVVPRETFIGLDCKLALKLVLVEASFKPLLVPKVPFLFVASEVSY
jgi:hypothetical protein